MRYPRIKIYVLVVLFVSLTPFLLTSCGGKGSAFPVCSIEATGSFPNGAIHLIDRKINTVTLDMSENGYAVIEISTLDKMQINNRVVEIPWKIRLKLQESAIFKIIKR